MDFGYKVFTFFDCLFQGILLSATLPHYLPHNPRSMRLRTMTGFGLFRFRSPLLTESRLISFPHLTEMFQFRWCPAHRYVNLSIAFTMDSPPKAGRLLDSETAGSQEYGSSLTSIAAICVLPRHEYPRHPLSAYSVAENKVSVG